MQDLLSSIAANPWLRAAGGVLSLTLLAWATNFVARSIFMRLLHRVASRTQSTWDDRLIGRRGVHAADDFLAGVIQHAGVCINDVIQHWVYPFSPVGVGYGLCLRLMISRCVFVCNYP